MAVTRVTIDVEDDLTQAASDIQEYLDNLADAIDGAVLPATEINVSHTPYTVLDADSYISASAFSGAVSILLPASAGNGRVIIISKPDASSNAVTITPDGTEKINFAA